jgi:hypothetical protein
MILIDEEDRKQNWLAVVAFALLMLMAAFAWGAWVQRSDARALEQIASEQCKPGEVAFVRPDGSQTICVQGSNRMGNRR